MMHLTSLVPELNPSPLPLFVEKKKKSLLIFYIELIPNILIISHGSVIFLCIS